MGILQARIKEWLFPPPGESSRDWTQVSCISGRFFYHMSYQESATRILIVRNASFDYESGFLKNAPWFCNPGHNEWQISQVLKLTNYQCWGGPRACAWPRCRKLGLLPVTLPKKSFNKVSYMRDSAHSGLFERTTTLYLYLYEDIFFSYR